MCARVRGFRGEIMDRCVAQSLRMHLVSLHIASTIVVDTGENTDTAESPILAIT